MFCQFITLYAIITLSEITFFRKRIVRRTFIYLYFFT